MVSRNRDIANILGKTEAANTDNSSLSFGPAGLSYYDSIGQLPTTGMSSGDQAFVAGTSRLYVSNGSGWYNVSLVNLAPQFDSDVNSAFTILDSQTPLVITNPASDSDAPDAIISYGGTMSDSGQYLVVLTRDSSVWTFTPRSSDSVYANVLAGNIPDSNGGNFTYTFTATDGISQVSKQITITYTDLATSVAFTVYNGYQYGWHIGGSGEAAQQFSLTSDTNATDVNSGSFTVSPSPVYSDSLQYPYGGGGDTKGYVMGGFVSPPAQTVSRVDIYSYPYANGTVSDNGNNLSYQGYRGHQEMIGNRTYIYRAAGFQTPGASYPQYQMNVIDKFPEASGGNATDVGDTTLPVAQHAGHSSETHAYTSGGYENAPTPTFSPNGPFSNKVQKWPFASDANATDVGDLTVARAWLAGTSSGDNGYAMGGRDPSSPTGGPSGSTNVIDKFAFASDGNATDVGDLIASLQQNGGISSRTHGYLITATGSPGEGVNSQAITKMGFASESHANTPASLAPKSYSGGALSQN